jgi:multisubunit Na+/H+ antiporter MnhE subunit
VRIVEIPTDTQSKIEYVVLKVYAYWPPGTFYFDNVSMKECAR